MSLMCTHSAESLPVNRRASVTGLCLQPENHPLIKSEGVGHSVSLVCGLIYLLLAFRLQQQFVPGRVHS